MHGNRWVRYFIGDGVGGNWLLGCKRANQVPGAKSCHKDVEGENMKRGVGDTRTKVEKGRKLERSVPYGLG